MTHIEIVAHRGYQKMFPENTLVSMAEAIKAGALYIETDIQLSADELPVLYHDRTMERLSNKPGAVHEYSFVQLSMTPLYEPDRFRDQFINQTISPLSDLVTLLLAHPYVHAFIEVKRCTIDFHGIETVYQRVCDALGPIKKQCTMMSFSLPYMQFAKASGWKNIGIVLEQGDQVLLPEVKTLTPDFIFCNHETMPSAAVDMRATNSEWVFYEIDKAETAFALKKQGVNFVETFDFVGLKSVIEES